MEETGATSFYDATAVREGGGWRVCWFGQAAPGSEYWLKQCRTGEVFDRGWVYLPCCPNHPLPMRWLAWFDRWAGTPSCEDIEDQYFLMDWQPGVEPYGQWVGEFNGKFGGVMRVEVAPQTGCLHPGQQWTYVIYWDGNECDRGTMDSACGGLPFLWTMTMNDRGPCPGITMQFWVESGYP